MTKPSPRVLFLCIHNSARSQMAAAFLGHLGGGRFRVESAGLEPGTLNPLAVRAMADAGRTTRLQWSFADPSQFTGTDAERLRQTIAVRDEIRAQVERWIAEK